MDIITEFQGYLAYMVRIWQMGEPGQPIVRIQLVSPYTGDSISFKNFEEMTSFLEAEMANRSLTRFQPGIVVDKQVEETDIQA